MDTIEKGKQDHRTKLLVVKREIGLNNDHSLLLNLATKLSSSASVFFDSVSEAQLYERIMSQEIRRFREEA
jgi:hypothetical protein